MSMLLLKLINGGNRVVDTNEIKSFNEETNSAFVYLINGSILEIELSEFSKVRDAVRADRS